MNWTVSAQRRRAVLVLGLMACTAAGARWLVPTTKLADQRPRINLQAMFPAHFGAWTLDDRVPLQLVSPDTQAVLDRIYNQVLSRTYIGPDGARIMLSVAYGGDQSDSTKAHLPEVCYPAQGFQVLTSRVGGLVLDGHAESLRVKQLVTKLGPRIEPITYWITVGEEVTVGGMDQKLAQMKYTTRGLIPDGMLLRISSIDDDPVRAYKQHRLFANALYAALASQHKTLVFGRQSA